MKHYDAVEAAIPVVTFEGNHHRARFAAATFKQMGVTGTIVYQLADYVETAVAIAINVERRKKIIQELKENSSKIFDDLSAVRELEDFLIMAIKTKLIS